MRDATTNSPRNFASNNALNTYPIRFTSDAIRYLSATHTQINLDEWEWHEELINGQTHCVITNKIIIKR